MLAKLDGVRFLALVLRMLGEPDEIDDLGFLAAGKGNELLEVHLRIKDHATDFVERKVLFPRLPLGGRRYTRVGRRGVSFEPVGIRG